MKAFVIIVVCMCVKFSYQEEFSDVVDKYQARAKEIEDGCIKESNVEPELARTFITAGTFPDNGPLKCHIKCMFEKTGIITPDGRIGEESLKNQIGVTDPIAADKILQKCKVLRGADTCETAYKISKCVYGSAQEATKKT